MTREEKARNLFAGGRNCAQSVALAFADLVDIDPKTLEAASAPFGGGVGRMREICGAVSGMCMIIGLALRCDTSDSEQKDKLYATEREAADRFRRENGSVVCRDLIKEHPHGEVPNSEKDYCASLVASAARILESMNIFGE